MALSETTDVSAAGSDAAATATATAGDVVDDEESSSMILQESKNDRTNKQKAVESRTNREGADVRKSRLALAGGFFGRGFEKRSVRRSERLPKRLPGSQESHGALSARGVNSPLAAVLFDASSSYGRKRRRRPALESILLYQSTRKIDNSQHCGVETFSCKGRTFSCSWQTTSLWSC